MKLSLGAGALAATLLFSGEAFGFQNQDDITANDDGTYTISQIVLDRLIAQSANQAADAAADACIHRRSTSVANPTGYWCVVHRDFDRHQVLADLTWSETEDAWIPTSLAGSDVESSAPLPFSLPAGAVVRFCTVRGSNFDSEHDGWQGYGIQLRSNGRQVGNVSVGDRCTEYALPLPAGDEGAVLLTAFATVNGNVAVFGYWDVPSANQGEN